MGTIPADAPYASHADAGPSSRPQTTYETRLLSEYSNYDAPAQVPTVPGLIASVRGEASGGGPYPSDARPKAPRWSQDSRPPSSRSLADMAAAGASQSPIVPLRVKIPPPQEEICLECLMRDRDLSHVDVTSRGVWSRASDGEFARMLVEERTFDHRWEDERGFLAYEGPHKSARHRPASSSAESEWERDDERLQWVARADQELSRIVGWRGFSWEEDTQREDAGLPLAFRGRFEGGLYESGLRELARKVSHPFALLTAADTRCRTYRPRPIASRRYKNTCVIKLRSLGYRQKRSHNSSPTFGSTSENEQIHIAQTASMVGQ